MFVCLFVCCRGGTPPSIDATGIEIIPRYQEVVGTTSSLNVAACKYPPLSSYIQFPNASSTQLQASTSIRHSARHLKNSMHPPLDRDILAQHRVAGWTFCALLEPINMLKNAKLLKQSEIDNLGPDFANFGPCSTYNFPPMGKTDPPNPPFYEC